MAGVEDEAGEGGVVRDGGGGGREVVEGEGVEVLSSMYPFSEVSEYYDG